MLRRSAVALALSLVALNVIPADAQSTEGTTCEASGMFEAECDIRCLAGWKSQIYARADSGAEGAFIVGRVECGLGGVTSGLIGHEDVLQVCSSFSTGTESADCLAKTLGGLVTDQGKCRGWGYAFVSVSCGLTF